MSVTRGMSRWIARIGGLLILGASMNADAGWFGFGGTSWKEEALLHDGSKVVVERWQNYGGRHEIGQAPPIKEQTMTFVVPGTKERLTWKSEYGEELGRTNFIPIALHILNDAPYVIATPHLCLSYNKWGRPNPPYVIFKHDKGEWRRIPLQELPGEFKDVNLVVSTKGEEKALTAESVVAALMVRKLNQDMKQPEYRSILREVIKPPAPGSSINCPVPTSAAGKLIAPEIDGKPLNYNWWPLAQDWLKKTYGASK